jgi:CRP/FNR family transcriptional regulator, cyclic AMP receptor protein
MSIASNVVGAGQPSGCWEAVDFESFAAAYGGRPISKVKAGTAIYAQGDPAEHLFYICTGQVRIKVVSPQGKVAIMATLEDDAFFGETCLLGETTRVATAICLSDCVLVRMSRTDAIQALGSNPCFAEFLLMRIMHRGRRLRSRLVSHLFEDSEQRLARILLMLANHGNSRDDTIIPKLDQEELAQMVGTTRARISYFMNKFRNLGYIDYNGNIAVRRSLSHVLAAEFGNREDAIENL